MHLFHGIAEFDTESTKDVSLPGIVFSVDFGLDLFVVDDDNTEGMLRLRVIES